MSRLGMPSSRKRADGDVMVVGERSMLLLKEEAEGSRSHAGGSGRLGDAGRNLGLHAGFSSIPMLMDALRHQRLMRAELAAAVFG